MWVAYDTNAILFSFIAMQHGSAEVTDLFYYLFIYLLDFIGRLWPVFGAPAECLARAMAQRERPPRMAMLRK